MSELGRGIRGAGWLGVGAAAAMLLVSVTAAEPARPDTTKPSLDDRIAAIVAEVDGKRQELHVPGVSLAIVKDDHLLYLGGMGLRDVEKKLPATPDTLFAIGSCTKAFTAATVLMAAEDGRLKLTDPPRNYLPYFRLRDAETNAKITIADLLDHGSGLPRTDLGWYLGNLSRREVIEVAGAAKPTAALRERWQYQNVMFLAAGEIAASAEKQPWEELVRRRLLTPLGMARTGFTLHGARKSGELALGYYWNPGKNQAVHLPMHDVENIAPAGAINSSARDMARWVRLLLNGGTFEGKRLLSEASLREAWSPHMKVSGTVDYGYGWFLRKWRGHAVVEHGGNIDGFNAEVALMPDQHLGFVLLTNISASSLGSVARESVWKHLVEAPEEPSTPAPTPAARPAEAEYHAPLEVTELLRRVVDAAGGEADLRRHWSLVTRYTGEVAHEGLSAEQTVWQRAPGDQASSLVVRAAGKKILEARNWCSAAGAGQQQDRDKPVFLEKQDLADTRIEAAFTPDLDWQSLYQHVRIRKQAKVEGEDAYVVELTPAQGSVVVEYVSTKSFLVLRREIRRSADAEPSAAETYSDYRPVEGVLLPYRRVSTVPGIGEITLNLVEATWDRPVREAVFQPFAPPPAARAAVPVQSRAGN